MNASATSLDRLHDIVLPPEVSWWPPAPGVWLILAAVLAFVLLLAFRAWRRWRSNAYRRVALRQLATASSPTSIAELLRRTALASFPREVVASKSGNEWVDWLAAQSSEPITAAVREQLTSGVYAAPASPADFALLVDFARRWIRDHRSPHSKRLR